MGAKRSEAGKKAAATRRANLARKATEANAEDRPGQMGDVPPVLEDEDAPVTTPGSFFFLKYKKNSLSYLCYIFQPDGKDNEDQSSV